MDAFLQRLDELDARIVAGQTTIREIGTGQRYTIIGGLLAGGGYYIIDAIDPPAGTPAWARGGRLQPGHLLTPAWVIEDQQGGHTS